METFLPPATPGTTKTHEIEFREPWELPPVGKETPEVYITAVKHDAPFEFFDLGSVCFSKKEYHPDRSLAENDGKYFPPLLRTTMLTKTQAEACRARAKERRIHIPSRPNPNFNPSFNEPERNVEYLAAYDVFAGDWLIIEPASEYRPFMPSVVPPPEKPRTTAEDITDELYKQQGKRK